VIEPVDWSAPDPEEFDGLLLTSANAVRFSGPGLQALMHLPAYAVGTETAAAASAMGLRVDSVGQGGVDDVLGSIPGSRRLLHLAGEQRREVESVHEITSLVVYRSSTVEQPPLPSLDDLVIAVHSPRAAIRLSELATDRGTASVAAISKAAASACGEGWKQIAIARSPDDSSLLALCARLCQDLPPG
jgi:uroporphyrinogen-III synthase